jgi:hypothetical protein
MRPTKDALQVFYGTIPLIVVLAGMSFRKQLLLNAILKRLGAIQKIRLTGSGGCKSS